jgi:membrane-associated phospholipid phosphatase
MRWRALKTSVLLSLLFVAVYGACNLVTDVRGNAGRFYFEWERGIPFVTWMIVPYMSIDLFFIAAPFFCRTDRALRTFGARVALAIVIAGVFFLIVPMQFAFVRPVVGGWLGFVFNDFLRVDYPFNEFPSLHIALSIILAELYGRWVGGVWKWAAYTGFGVIGASTVFVYQHHVIDVLGGIGLAAIVFYVTREDRPAATRNAFVGLCYAAGAGGMVGAGMLAGRWGWLAIWPAVSLVIVAAGYFGLGAGVYAKCGGRLPWASWVLLWPVLVAQWISLWHYARRCRAWDTLTERVWIGRQLTEREAQAVMAEGVRAVLDLTGEFSEASAFMGAEGGYRAMPVLDLTAPTLEQLREAAKWIAEQAANGIVYIHCKVGYSRTAAVAGAYLLAMGKATSVREALEMLRAARPGIVVRPEAERALHDFAAGLGRREGWEGAGLDVAVGAGPVPAATSPL